MATIALESGLSADESISVVDEDNVVVGSCRRADMRAQNLRHRATYIFLLNSSGQLLVQKRSAVKDYCPGYFDCVSGGVVGAGESYEDNCRRELEEEMGVTEPCAHLFTFYFEDEHSSVWGDAWECVWDGELTLQEEEVDSVHPMLPAEVLERHAAGEKFTPDSIAALRRYLEFKEEAAAAVAAADGS